MKVTEQVAQFAEPVVQAHGCTLWDVEYVREGGEWFLRLYIDKDGGVDISDCEAISRALDPILDEKDPVPDSYNFEVCSAGLERQLKRPSDFAQFMGSSVSVKLFKPIGGAKEFIGKLAGYADGAVTIELHIIVENGVNIATVCRSIMGEVKYVVNLNTGVTVKAVNVCVDSVTV